MMLASSLLFVLALPVVFGQGNSTVDSSSLTLVADSKNAPKYVKGAAFDRIVFLWLENTNYFDAFNDPNLHSLLQTGILQENYYAIGHDSYPNYIAAVGGDYFGKNNDNNGPMLPANVSTVVDLLDTKGISWKEYQEGMPSTGFLGDFPNPVTKASRYKQKHNPLSLYESVMGDAKRRNNIQNFTNFFEDLKKEVLPQWMFITPNMTNDGHDTDVTFAGKWVKSFLFPLLKNEYFMKNTLIQVTFDECGSAVDNRVFSVLLGDAVPRTSFGKVDSTFYSHYSGIHTVSDNFGLNTLGRWDTDANVYDIVAKKTGYQNQMVDIHSLLFAESCGGPQNSQPSGCISQPNTKNRNVLPSIIKTWGKNVGVGQYVGPIPPQNATPPGLNQPLCESAADQCKR